VKQYPDSPYYQYYKETLDLVRQMQKEEQNLTRIITLSPLRGIFGIEEVEYCHGGVVSSWMNKYPVSPYLRYSYFYQT